MKIRCLIFFFGDIWKVYGFKNNERETGEIFHSQDTLKACLVSLAAETFIIGVWATEEKVNPVSSFKLH